MDKPEPSYNDLKMQNANLISCLTKLEEEIRLKGVEFIAICSINEGKSGRSYDDLLKRVIELEEENQELENTVEAYYQEIAGENW